MLIGGFSTRRDVELVDFSKNKSLSLPKPADLPTDMDGLVADVVNGQVIACGGQHSADCYIYSFKSNTWTKTVSMDQKRWGATSFVHEGKWYILGGGTALSSTLIYENGKFSPGPNMPKQAQFACSVLVNSTHFFYAGGQDFGNALQDAYLVELVSWKWTKLEDMRYRRVNPTCGMVGRNVVVEGGNYYDVNDGNAEMYSLETGMLFIGPQIPTESGRFRDAPNVLQLKNTFYVLGGYDEIDYLDTVYQVDVENTNWKLRNERLKVPRIDHEVVAIPRSILKN